jgi:Family of unknown function (DUF6069)
MATTRSAIPTSSPATRSRRRTRVLAVVGAALATLTVWVVADPLAGVDLTVRQGSGASLQEVGPAAVLLVTVLAGLAGWALLAFLERRSSSAGRTWTVLAVVVTVLSLTGPLTAGTTTASKAVLMGMHLAAAAVLVPLLARSART